MEQKKKSTRRTSKSTKRKSNIKKGKVYIPAYKIITLCLGVIAICILLLLATTLAKPKADENKSESQSITKRYENDAANKQKDSNSTELKTSQTKQKTESNNEKKVASAPKKQEQKKSAATTPKTTETPKTEQKPVEIKKIEPEKQPAKTVSKAQPQPEIQKPVPQKSPVPPAPVKSDFDFPAAKNNAQLIFVFDDGGQNLGQIDKFTSQLKFPYTVAVLPRLAHSVETARKVRNSGNEVILHQPMQSVNPKVNPGPGAITPSMNEDQIIATLFQNVQEISPIMGINNHEGSAITADAEKMAVVMKFACEEGLYFLDSRTNVETKVPYVAQTMGYSYYERNIFLDNEKSRENIMKELRKGIDIANKKGFVIMIGHVWSADLLPGILSEVYPELVKKGYTFSTVSKSKARL